jgi:3-hydroxyacyl-[acyl-carrier-protein] dehydratase
LLRDVKNVKYGTFMLPGRRMDVAVDLIQAEGNTASFRGKGADDAGQPTVSAQFTLAGYSLRDRGPAGEAADERILESLKARWALLTGELAVR